MHHPKTQPIQGLTTSLTLALLASPCAAVCTNWTHISISTEVDTSSHAVSDSQSVDSISCPADAEQSCKFNKTSYHVVVERTLTPYWEPDAPLALPADEADAIFDLAARAFNSDMENGEEVELVTLEGDVSVEELIARNSSLLYAEPGAQWSLDWGSYFRTSVGNLSGCSNASLNGMQVEAKAPYFEENSTVLAGSWGAGGSCCSKKSEAQMLGRSLRDVAAWMTAVLVFVTFPL